MSALVVLQEDLSSILYPHGSSQWSMVLVPQTSKGTWHTSCTQTYVQATQPYTHVLN